MTEIVRPDYVAANEGLITDITASVTELLARHAVVELDLKPGEEPTFCRGEADVLTLRDDSPDL